MSSSVRKCNCIHPYQDQTYGKGNRVHNKCTKGHRCTVCGDLKNADKVETKPEAETKAKA